MKAYRINGAIGALLDEYERALIDIKKTVSDVTPHELTVIVDRDTKDPSCRSIQTVLTHVIRAGYYYAFAIRKSLGDKVELPADVVVDNIEDYQVELDNMFKYNEELFAVHPDIKLEEYDNEKKILVRWGQLYDVEQLYEHAIVHILRHRRQLEKFLIKLGYRR